MFVACLYCMSSVSNEYDNWQPATVGLNAGLSETFKRKTIIDSSQCKLLSIQSRLGIASLKLVYPPWSPPCNQQLVVNVDLNTRKQEGNGPLDLRRQGLWEIGMWCSLTSITFESMCILPRISNLVASKWPQWPQNLNLTSNLKLATSITLVSLCMLPPTAILVASEAMVASKQPRRSHLASESNSVTSITYVPMSFWLQKVSMS